MGRFGRIVALDQRAEKMPATRLVGLSGLSNMQEVLGAVSLGMRSAADQGPSSC